MSTLLVLTVSIATLTDLRSRVVPNRLLLAAGAAAMAIALVGDPGSVPGRLLAATACGGFLLAAALARPGGMGMGDVKLAALIGFCLAGGAALALIVALLVGAVVGGVARLPTIPFAPCLAVGAVVALAQA